MVLDDLKHFFFILCVEKGTHIQTRTWVGGRVGLDRIRLSPVSKVVLKGGQGRRACGRMERPQGAVGEAAGMPGDPAVLVLQPVSLPSCLRTPGGLGASSVQIQK